MGAIYVCKYVFIYIYICMYVHTSGGEKVRTDIVKGLGLASIRIT